MFVTHKYRTTGEINELVQDWELNTPKDVRDGGIRDLDKAYTTNIKNVKSCKISHFRMKYRKRNKNSSIVIPKSAVSIVDGKLKLYPRRLPQLIRMSRDKSIRGLTITHDCRLQYKFGKWYLAIPIDCKGLRVSGIKQGVCALDPGVRKFQTIYNENRVTQVVHNKDFVSRLQQKLDMFRSLRDRKLISRSHYSRRIRRIYEKLSNFTDELHYKTISYLSDNYRLILIPIFESQEIAKKSRNRRMNRNLLQLQHFKFRMRLKDHCKVDKYTDMVTVSEAHTSRTCSFCGNYDANIGSNEIYECDKCGMKYDRDVNASKNILLRYCRSW